MQQSALAVLGRPDARGRRGRTIEQSARWRLRAISEGSVVVEMELPERVAEADALELDVQNLAEEAIHKALRVVTNEDATPEVAASLAELSNDLDIGERYEGLWIEVDGPKPRRAEIDSGVRERLRELATTRADRNAKRDKVTGTLYEADFEKNTAHLRIPEGKSVRVSFRDAMADDIQMALRHPAELEGEIEYDPRTSMAVAVELRSVRRADQLMIGLDTGEFWRNPTIEELRQAHGVAPIEDLDSLRISDASDEELEAFLEALSG